MYFWPPFFASFLHLKTSTSRFSVTLLFLQEERNYFLVFYFKIHFYFQYKKSIFSFNSSFFNIRNLQAKNFTNLTLANFLTHVIICLSFIKICLLLQLSHGLFNFLYIFYSYFILLSIYSIQKKNLYYLSYFFLFFLFFFICFISF